MSRKTNFDGTGKLSNSNINFTREKESVQIHPLERENNKMYKRSRILDRRKKLADNRYDLEGKPYLFPSIDECKRFAQDRGLICLDDKYINNRTPISWKCSSGHIFKRNISDMLRGSAKCSQCYHGRSEHSRKTWDQITASLKRRGLEPLFVYEQYKNIETELKFKHVKCGNEFVSRYRQVFQLKDGTACPKCNTLCKKGSLEECQKLAKKKGGECIYFSGKVKESSKWKCSQGHTWEAPLYNIRLKQWCIICEYDSRIKYKTEEEIKLIGRLRGYKKRDREKNRTCDLDFNDMKKLSQFKCFYCYEKPSGYDRIENTLGHLKTNVVPACQRCNRLRMDNIPFDLMIEIGKTIKNFYDKSN